MFSRNLLATLGLVVSLIYFLFLSYAIFSDWTDFQALKLNEWSDFLAGSLGPITTFWLILVFFQQSRELQHSVDALLLQAKEMEQSVEQQKAMAGIASKQFELDRAIRECQISLLTFQVLPFFVIEQGGGRSNCNQYLQDILLKNIGANAARYTVDISGEHVSENSLQLPSLETNKSYETYLTIRDLSGLENGYLAMIKVKSKNLRGQSRTQEFELRSAHGIESLKVQPIDCTPPR